MAGKDNLKPFAQGDKRINRKGRPKSFGGLRDLAQQISHETIPGKDGNPYTVAEAILRKWATSGNPTLQMKFVEVAFGKVPNEVETEYNPLTPSGIFDYSQLTPEEQDERIRLDEKALRR